MSRMAGMAHACVVRMHVHGLRLASIRQPVAHQLDLGLLAQGDPLAHQLDRSVPHPRPQQFDHLDRLTVVDDHMLHELHIAGGEGRSAERDGLCGADDARWCARRAGIEDRGRLRPCRGRDQTGQQDTQTGLHARTTPLKAKAARLRHSATPGASPDQLAIIIRVPTGLRSGKNALLRVKAHGVFTQPMRNDMGMIDMKRLLLAGVASLVFAGPSWSQAPQPAPTPEPTPDPATAASTEAKDDDAPKWDVQDPPGPSRDIPIDVTRGTWMSLDVSPDGQTVVFDMLGDIYVMPIAGGEARAIAVGVAWDMQPKWSPDGRHIAFTSDRAGGDNIWIMDADGSNPTQVSKETFRLLNQPEWTPDGQFIVGAQTLHLRPVAGRRRAVDVSPLGRRRRADDRAPHASRRTRASPPSRPTAAMSISATTPRRATPSNTPRTSTARSTSSAASTARRARSSPM